MAIYGLRRAIKEGAQEHDADSVKFVERHFHIDDGLVSVLSETKAVDLLQRAQASFAESKRPSCAPVIKDLDLSGETAPTQRSLVPLWEITTNMFTYPASTMNKPLTCHGVLSTVNSVFPWICWHLS